MNKLLTLFAMTTLGLVIGCGQTASPPTEEETKAVQAPVDDYMKKMQNMDTSNMKNAPEMGVPAAAEAPAKNE